MPKVIQFTNQLFDYGVERFFPEKVTEVRASTIDSRFLSSHGRYCIVADDGLFVTHVGLELGKAARHYVESVLDWDFTFYDDPTATKPEESEDDGEDDGDDPTGETGEGSDGSDPEASGEADGEGSADGAGDGGEETSETSEDVDEGSTTIVTPPVPAENIEAQITITEDAVTVDPVEDNDPPSADDTPAPKEEAPKPKATSKKKKGGRKGKKK